MKKFISTFCVAFLLLLSCTKNEDISNTNDVNQQKVNMTLNEKDYETQKSMYNLLSASEKYFIWDNKVNDLLKDEKLNNSQKSVLLDLKNNLSVTIFDSESLNDEAEIFKNVYAVNFLKKANKHFTSDYVLSNLFSLSKIYTGEGSCTCSNDSSVTCGIGTGINCGAAVCKATTSGCGFLWDYACNGRCNVLQN